jgi:oligopeptide transport system substrate-binding protein
MLAGFNSGTLSFIDDVPNDEIEALRPRSDFHIMGQIGTYYVSYNVKVPPLDNPKFRKAMTLAIDRDFITKNIGKAGQINAGAYVSEGISDAAPGSSFREVGGNYYDPSPEGYAANLAEAKAIIAELYPDGNVPSLSYIYNTSTGHQLIGEALQQMWADIGVTVTLEVQEWSVFLNTRKNGEYQIARNGWLNDYNDPIGMLDMWITGGGNNDAQWSNAEYDALIAKAKTTSDAAERMGYLHKMEDIIFAEWMLAPIYYYVDIYMIDDTLNGFFASPLGYKYFMYTYR